MTDRQMARVTAIDEIAPIEGADKIEKARIGGWWVVVSKDEFREGDVVVYFEIDSALPVEDPRFEFLASRGTKKIDDRPYHVLKTIKLRKQVSQGLILPVAQFEAEITSVQGMPMDLAETIGVFKYEPPVPMGLQGQMKGNFPSDVQKTDAERVQNISPVDYSRMRDHYQWVATEKIDGSSGTYIMREEGIDVASRNWLLTETDNNHFWGIVKKYNLREKMPVGMVIQGEVYGEGIQANRLGVIGVNLAIFRLMQDGVDVPRDEWPEWAKTIAVPVYSGMELPETIAEAVDQVDGIKSLMAPGRLAEGVVWHTVDGSIPSEIGRTGFKAISNKYLLRGGE